MRNPLDDSIRRRIYLLRHAEAAYQAADGTAASDPRSVSLTERGRVEANQLRELLAGIEFDFALCSGLPRTVQTAQIVLDGQGVELEVDPDLEELRAGWEVGATPAQVAYALEHATEPEAAFMDGERFAEFAARVTGAFERHVHGGAWRDALFVCHGGTNRAILGWAMGAGLQALASIEQDSCCLNILDVDVEEATGKLLRRYVRMVNLTPYDLSKRELRLTSLEHTALALARHLEARREESA